MAFVIAEGVVKVKGVLDEPSHRRAAQRAGERVGDHYATAFGMSANRRWRRMTRLFMAPIDAMSSALSAIRGPSLRGGVLAGILGLIPSAGKAAAAIGASLVPALLSLGAVVGVVRLMLGALHKDIKGQTLELLNKMAGRIRDLAREAAKPGLNAFLEGVVKNGPLFETYIQRIARAVGNALSEVGDLLGDSGFVNKLNSLLEQSAESTAIWTRSLDDVVEMLVTLGDAASPIFHDMAVRVNQLTDRWRDFLNLKHETGELQQFLMEAAEELNRWGRIFNNVIIGLYNIFAAGVGPSSQFAESLERITASFREWTTQNENVEKVRAVFQWMVDHVDDFFRIAVSAAAIAAALKGIGLAMEVVNFGRLLFQLGTIGGVLAIVGISLAAVAGAFFIAYNTSETFRAKVAELWALIQEKVFPILREWGTWIKEELAPALEEFANTTMQKLIESLDILVTKYNENKKGIQEMRQLFVDLQPVVAFFAENAIEEIAGFVGQVMTAVGWVGNLVGIIRKIPVGWITHYLFKPGAAVSAILRVTGLTKAIPKAWRTIYKFLGSIGPIKSVISWIARIPRNVTTTFTSITRNITESITRFLNPLARASGGIVGAQGMATGGIAGARSVLVGEHGPEMVRLPYGSSVTPAGQTRAQLGGGQQRVIIEIRSAGARLDDLLVEVLRKSIRSLGGDVQVALGS